MAEADPDNEAMTQTDFYNVIERIENFDIFFCSTGNSILMKNVFKADDSCDSVTDRVQSETTNFKNRFIKVVDGPGIADTRDIRDTKEAAEKVLQEMRDTIKLNTKGYHAFLLVIKYPTRITKEERDCIETLKFIFGNDFIQKYCIIVVTGGDDFDRKWREKNKTFKEWCEEQTQETFKYIYNECEKRIVLFNNTTKSYKKKKNQLKKLLKIVDRLSCDHQPFVDSHFEMAGKMLDKEKVKLKDPKLRQILLEKIHFILQLEVWIHEQPIEDQLDYLKKLRETVDKLVKYLKEEHNKSGLLKSLIKYTKLVLNNIINKIKQIEEILKVQGTSMSTQEELRAMKETLANTEMEYKHQKAKFKKLNKQESKISKKIEAELKSIEKDIAKETDKESKESLGKKKVELDFKQKLQELENKKKEREMTLIKMKNDIKESGTKYYQTRKSLEEQDLENLTKSLPTEAEKRNAKLRITEESERKKKEFTTANKAKINEAFSLYQNKKRHNEDRVRKSWT
ncbi:hypothetical protein Btru_077684 [Bulinus truncatus]|nr:hypothetical protein Btru_077684 [Bulinus truncatus]